MNANETNPLAARAAMTTNEKASLFWKCCEETTINLFARWLDECDYEDINDYAAPLRNIARQHDGVEVTKMYKRPFGFTFTIEGATYQASCNMTAYKLKRTS